MSDRTVTGVIGPEPMRENEYPIVYLVGSPHGSAGTPKVEAITQRHENMGTYGLNWYDVAIEGGAIVASLNSMFVAEVRYGVPE